MKYNAKVYPNYNRSTLSGTELSRLAREGKLWHYDSQGNRFYYDTATPVNLDSYVGYTHVASPIHGTKSVNESNAAIELSLL